MSNPNTLHGVSLERVSLDTGPRGASVTLDISGAPAGLYALVDEVWRMRGGLPARPLLIGERRRRRVLR